MLITKRSFLATSIISICLSAVSLTALNAEEKTATDVVIATVNGDNIMKSTLDGYLAVLKKSGKIIEMMQ